MSLPKLESFTFPCRKCGGTMRGTENVANDIYFLQCQICGYVIEKLSSVAGSSAAEKPATQSQNLKGEVVKA